MTRAIGWWLQRSPFWHWLLVLLWGMTIFWLSSQSGESLPKVGFELPHLDKFAHFVAYACGGVLTTLALRRSSVPWRQAVVASVLLLALFGASDEWHQLSTPGRMGGDLFDWLADLLGAVAGSAFIHVYARSHPADSA